MKLEITKEKILEAASKCSVAKETLKTLFPEVFEDDRYLDLNSFLTPGYRCILDSDGHTMIDIRASGKYTNKGFFLSDNYVWTIERCSRYPEIDVLVPTKKEK